MSAEWVWERLPGTIVPPAPDDGDGWEEEMAASERARDTRPAPPMGVGGAEVEMMVGGEGTR